MALAHSLITPGQFWLGVFVSVMLGGNVVYAGPAGNCSLTELSQREGEGTIEWARLAKVVDGDTLRLTDGRKVRLVAVNTPELARNQQPSQPLAGQAKLAAEQFFSRSQQIALQVGMQPRDKYGRVLAHVFNRDGDSLAAALLVQGLAWHIAVPPNVAYADCLRRVENSARKQGRGLWQGGGQVLNAGRLARSNDGFQRVKGEILAVERSRNSWWLQLGELAVRLNDSDLHYFGQEDPAGWPGRTVVIRGWVVERHRRQSLEGLPPQVQGQRQYPGFMMQLRHPAMIEFTES